MLKQRAATVIDLTMFLLCAWLMLRNLLAETYDAREEMFRLA